MEAIVRFNMIDDAGNFEHDRPSPAQTPATEPRKKPKQTRKKPTLNCDECVRRKMRCGRARPTCLSCIRNQSKCSYSNIADILFASQGNAKRDEWSSGTSWQSPAPWSTHHAHSTSDGDGSFIPDHTSGSSIDPMLNHSPGTSEFLLLQHKKKTTSKPAIFNTGGVSSRHPFHNYWTNAGGLAEVISVLPAKAQADILVERFFDCVDPLYPILMRSKFLASYETFWSMTPQEMAEYDPAQLALHFAIYAAGSPFVESLSQADRVSSADFYLSASHQSLCIFSYLNRSSLATMQTMVLICCVLINQNRISDAWTFSGVTQRQAYGLELNRNPEMISEKYGSVEEQLRCKLWLAVMFQDASLSLYLELPPNTLHYDVSPSCLRSAAELRLYGADGSSGLHGYSEAYLPDDISSANDVSYLRSMWEFSSFVQQNMCIARSLNRVLSKDPTHKLDMITRLRNLYRSCASPFNSFDPARFEPASDMRLVRQSIAVTNNYFYVLTMLYIDEDEGAGTQCDVFGALDAAHEAMLPFFALIRFCPTQMDIWGAYNTRAFSLAMMIGKILAAQTNNSAESRDARLMLAKSDFDRYIDSLARARGAGEFEIIQQQRLAELQELRKTITVA